MRPVICLWFFLLIFTASPPASYAKNKSQAGGKGTQTKTEKQKKLELKKDQTTKNTAKPKQNVTKQKEKLKTTQENGKTKQKRALQKSPPPLNKSKSFSEPKLVYNDPQILQAVSHANDRMFDSAKVLLLSALSRPVKHKERATLLLAHVMMQTKDYESAINLLNELEQSSLPVADWVLLIKGKALFALGRFKEAREALQRVPKSSSRYDEAKKLLGDCMMALGDAQGAEAIFKELVDSGKKEASILVKYAGALQAQGKTEEAVKILRNGYFSNTGANRAPFLSALGPLLEGMEATAQEKVLEAKANIQAFKYEEAKSAAEEAIRNATDDKTRCEALLLRARALSGLRKYSDAVDEFSRVLSGACKDLVDAPYALFHAIRSAMRASSNDKAWEFYQTLTKKFGDSSFCDDVAVWFARGAIRQGEYETARKILVEALSKWPQGDMAMEARWLLTLTSILEKRYTEAKKEMEKALSETQDPLAGSRFCYFLAWTDLATGNKAKARQRFYECSVSYPMTFYGFLASMRAGVLEQKVALKTDKSGDEDPQKAGNASSDYPEGLRNAVWLYESGLFQLAGEEVSSFEPSSFEEAVMKTLILAKAKSATQAFRFADIALKRFPVTPPSDNNRGFFEIAFPRPYQDEVQRAAKESHIDPYLIYAVMREESAFNPDALSPAGAVGLLQLMPATAEMVAKKFKLKVSRQSLYQPSINIRLGARFLSELEKSLKHPFFVIAAYNAGAGAITRWQKENPSVPFDLFVELIGAEETRNYVKKVFSSYCAYHLLYDQAKPFLKVELGHVQH